MGAYLSSPVVDKVSEDGVSDKFVYGAASMQGWRKHQEDAHIVRTALPTRAAGNQQPTLSNSLQSSPSLSTCG